MKYGNAIVREYPNHVNISVFNYNVVDDTRIIIKHKSDIPKDNSDEVTRISQLRAKHHIFDIAMLNKFDYFVTFTFNDNIIDAHDYELAIKKVKKWCQNAVQRQGLRYLLVPELHPTSGRIHLHGLLYFRDTPKLHSTDKFDKSHRRIYNLPMWHYGFSTIVHLDDDDNSRISKYITKYITKDLDKIVGNYYYAGGKDLLREPIKYYANIPFDDFEGRLCYIKDSMECKISLVTKENAIHYLLHQMDEKESLEYDFDQQ